MGREDNHRAAGRISRYLPHSTNRRVQWSPRGRILWVDIAIDKVDELEWVHDQMIKHEPCVAMVRVHQLIWTYYTGAAVLDQYHLVTIGQLTYDLMDDAFSFALSS